MGRIERAAKELGLVFPYVSATRRRFSYPKP